MGEVEKKAVDTLVEVVEKQADEIKSLNEKVTTLNETKTAIDKLTNAVDKLEKQNTFYPGTIQVKSNKPEGLDAARLMKCEIIATREKKNLDDVVQEMYGNRDEKFTNEIKTLVAGGNAGALIREGYFQELFPILRNKISFMQLGAREVPMPNGNLNIRKRVQGSSAQWIGEIKQPVQSQPRYANQRLNSKKLSVLVPVSNDLLRSSEFGADQIFLEDMVDEMAVALDKTMYYGAGTDFTPRGIINVDGITIVDNSTTLFDPSTVYRDLVLPVKQANIPLTKLGWAFSPQIFELIYNARDDVGGFLYRDELNNGTFHRYPFVETNQIEVGTTADEIADIFFGNYEMALIGKQLDMQMKISEEASYNDADGNARNVFSTDETLAMGLMICDLGLVYGKAFSYGKYKTR